MSCVYSNALKCEHCTYLIHRECKKFMLAHAKWLAQDLGSFVYSTRYRPSGQVMWSVDINRAKSLALQLALKYNRKVKKYTFSQIITLAVGAEQIEDRVVYVESLTRPNGDIDKLKSVFSSFVDASLLRNCVFVVYASPTSGLKFEYTKI